MAADVGLGGAPSRVGLRYVKQSRVVRLMLRSYFNKLQGWVARASWIEVATGMASTTVVGALSVSTHKGKVALGGVLCIAAWTLLPPIFIQLTTRQANIANRAARILLFELIKLRWPIWWRAALSGTLIGVAAGLGADIVTAAIIAVCGLVASFVSLKAGGRVEAITREEQRRQAGG